MRGFTMILVVYWHVICFVFYQDLSFVDVFFISFRMPLFFFISGLLAYSVKYDKQLYIKRVTNRIYGQLIPTFVVGILYALTINVTVSDFMLDPWKEGYWFTFCMFQVFLIYATLTYLLDRQNFSTGYKTVVYLTLMILLYIVLYILKNKNRNIWNFNIKYIKYKNDFKILFLLFGWRNL